jgi:rhodanese-related sulfurtransferase
MRRNYRVKGAIGMPTRVMDREEIRRLMDTGAALVEVLPREEYEFEHIAGATHIWLRDLDRVAPERLDLSTPVIVYCNDYL